MFHNLFAKTYLLNLNTRKDRLEKSTKECNSIGLKFERFSAIDGREERIQVKYYPKDPEYPELSNYWNAGTIGINRSLVKILKKAKRNKYESVLILEDDVKFHPFINEVVAYNFKDIPANWDFIYFGAQHVTPPEPITNRIARIKIAWCNHCFAIRHTMYDVLIEMLSKENKSADAITNELHKNGNSYCFTPNLAFQREDFSDHTQQMENEKI